MFKGVLAGVLVFGLAASIAAQTPGPVDAEQLRARRRVSAMESVLESAVRNGANNMLRQVQLVSADVPTLTGPPQVRGFRIAGYGLFFDVGVPGLRPPISWQLRTLGPDPFGGGSSAQVVALVERAKTMLGALERDQALDAQRLGGLQLVMNQLDAELARGRSASPRGQQFVNASNAAGAPAPTVSPAVPDVLDDPGVAYTREIQNALIEAMLENSGPLAVADDEWLTIAARDNLPRDPLVPGDMTDFTTMILTIKGADLSALHAKRITVEEARKRVQVSDQ